MFESDPEILPGWKMSVDELADEIYRVKLTQTNGKITEALAVDFDEAVRVCQVQAFEIEKEISEEWGRFIFETCKLKLHGKHIVEEVYHEMHFGSWLIELPHKRLVYDGKESCLLLQIKEENTWINQESFTDIENISIYKLQLMINTLKANGFH